MGDRVHARRQRLLALGTDIDLTRCILADKHHGQPRLDAVFTPQPRHIFGDLRADALGVDLAVDQLRG